MALVTTPRGTSANSNKVSATPTRGTVALGGQTASTARAEALKSRLQGQTPNQPVAPRPTRTSSRAEEISKLQKFQSPAVKVPQQMKQFISSRQQPVDFNTIEPPPSGLAEGSELVQPEESVETPETVTEANSKPISPQFVALARKEAQHRKALLAFEASKTAWEQDKAKYVSRDRLKSETLKVLAEDGITPDRLVELQIDQANSSDPTQILKSELAELKKQLDALTNPENGTLAQRDKAEYDQVVTQIQDDVNLLVDSNPAYETIKSEGLQKDVVELITSVFETEGKYLDVEEAAQLIEEKALQKALAQYERISKYEKIKAKLGKVSETPEANNAQQKQVTASKASSQPRTNTLTNAGSATAPLSARDKAVLLVQSRLDALKGR